MFRYNVFMSYDTEKIYKQLSALLSGGSQDVLIDIFNRIAFSTDASIYKIMPVCVAAPRTTEDVAAVVRYALENNIPVAGRGAGSGVAGEALTSGIVLDFTRNMNDILQIAEDGSTVTCLPGVVLDDLNAKLAEFDTKIGPDPSSGNRAVIGGILANNATGAHSLQYGYIADYVESVQLVLADGTIAEFDNDCDVASDDESDDASGIAKQVYDLLDANAEVISKAQPQTLRNRSGYNIAGVCGNGRIDLAKLLAGSEGTLAIFTKIKLRTVPVPKHRAILQLDFDSFESMARATGICVGKGASACELMDSTLINMTLEAYPKYSDIFTGDCRAQLLVEFTDDDPDCLRKKIDDCNLSVGTLSSKRNIVFDGDIQKRLWRSRKDAVPLLHRQKGPAHPAGFIEDTSVPNRRLAEYVAGLERIASKYEIRMAYYGHAGDGELHIRPYLDLYDADDVRKMRDIARDVFELAWSLGGTISGEHADGLVRAAFIEKQYGTEYYDVLKRVKNIFDPNGILNPGKIINDDPDVMTKNLRFDDPVVTERLETNLLFAPDEFRFEIEQCNGDGVCLSTQPGLRMCPVFRAIGDELACSRAKANMLRAWITGKLQRGDIDSPEFKRILGLCVNCKMCSIECPTGVDISKLMIEARTEYVRRKGLTVAEFALTHNRFLSVAGSMFAPLSGFVMSLAPFKWLLEKTIGLDRRRTMPAFLHGSFIKKAKDYLASGPVIDNPIDKVAYFVDSFANYNDHDLGFAVIKTLRHNNIDVVVPDQRPAPLPAIVYGDIDTAKKDLNFIVPHLAKAVRDGCKIVCSEPSAALCLKEDLRLYVDSDDARLVSANTYELMNYLDTLAKKSMLKTHAKANAREFAYHGPCHSCAMGISGDGIDLLARIAGANVTDINSGCCGLAGTCGMQKKNYDLSVKIGADMANALNATDTKYVLTECAACKMQIEQLTDKTVLHPIKIIAGAYGLI